MTSIYCSRHCYPKIVPSQYNLTGFLHIFAIEFSMKHFKTYWSYKPSCSHIYTSIFVHQYILCVTNITLDLVNTVDRFNLISTIKQCKDKELLLYILILLVYTRHPLLLLFDYSSKHNTKTFNISDL
jgi:hypothetical protein